MIVIDNDTKIEAVIWGFAFISISTAGVSGLCGFVGVVVAQAATGGCIDRVFAMHVLVGQPATRHDLFMIAYPENSFLPTHTCCGPLAEFVADGVDKREPTLPHAAISRA